MKDITSKLDSAFQTFQAWLYPEEEESVMCKLHEPFGSLINDKHNCLGCNFAESTGQIRDFFIRELSDPRKDVNDIMTDLTIKCYLLIERIYIIFDIINLPLEYRFKYFGVFQRIHKWANFIKHPKAFILVHHPEHYIEGIPGFDPSRFDVIVNQSFVDEFYSGPDKNKKLFDRLNNQTKVAVLYPDPETLISDFCAAAHKFVEVIKNNEVYIEILDSKTTYENYYTDLDEVEEA
jgi:hypothetical protein